MSQIVVSGYIIGGLELSLFFLVAQYVRNRWKSLLKISDITFYWMMLTVLTGLWEFAFLTHYDNVSHMANELIVSHRHVWTTKYDLSYVLPWKLSNIFYSEYGAYADREYMYLGDHWSRVIEGTHAFFCAGLSLMALIMKARKRHENYIIFKNIAMASQLMNSILYMAEYFIQINNRYSVNYINNEFPFGLFMLQRPFMYVNAFWMVMPVLVMV